jgi:hypothetical protein
MLRWPALALLAVLLPFQPPGPAPDAPTYTPDGQLKFPAGYPEWVFLGTGIDMSYTAAPAMSDGNSMFNNVFVNPSAYRAFKQTGHWPEGTTMVLENRGAAAGASINKRGKTESSEIMGIEIHVLDTAHLKTGWAFYGFDDPINDKSTGKLIARPATCYTCHEQHGAVDTTFTQFYPAAFAIAKQKNTLSPDSVAK